PFWVIAESISGHTTAPVFGSAYVGGTTGCTFLTPATPSMVAGNVTPISRGYHLHWYDSDPTAIGYLLNASAPNGSFQLLRVGNVTQASWTLGGSDVPYQLNVTAVNARGTLSSASTQVSGPPTLGALSISETRALPSSFLLGSASLNATGAVSGGVGPYVVTLWAGDGSVTTNDSLSGNFTLLHDFGEYWGTALVTLEATDAVGDVATLGPIAIQIFATPFGVIQIAAAGELVLNLSYSVPRSPVAPMTHYAIVMTTNPSLAWELEAGVTSNATVPGITVWNTTRAYLELDSPDGVTLYAQVLAVNYYGVGWLPEGNGTLTATPAALTMTPIVATPGGRAPFVDNVSASVTGGSNDTITNAIYSFPPDNIVTPTMQYVNGTTYLNASLTFPSPGTFVIVLHATDIFFGTAIETSIVYIAPGVSPAVSAQLVSLPAYVDAPLAFQAAATGGSGHYAWNWSFGDGNYSGLTNPIHSYAISGGYNVVLAVTDTITGGTNVTTLPIVVYALPVLFVSVTPGPNGSLSYDFHASVGGGSGASTIVWTFGDGGLARGVSVSHDYRATGTYLVNASATDPAGRSGTTEFNLSAFAISGSGTAPSSGLDSLDVTLIILATGFGVLALLLAVRRPAAPPPSEGESEDGEVSLT
ncbi:MAG TPA: PKD domain-containing protein, partial [Thermoplasmata archaeon]|nr:PKD domain-containing protein [Thermoplasmata archaeon]